MGRVEPAGGPIAPPARGGDLAGRAALVTGGCAGIGAAVTRALAAAGCRVAFTHFREGDEAAALARELREGGAEAHAFELDLSREEALPGVLDAVRGAVGDPLVLVNNARVDPFRRPEGMGEIDWWTHNYAVDVVGGHLLLRALWGGMVAVGFGRVVNVASIQAFGPSPEVLLPYGAAKAAQLNLTRSYAALGAPHAVTVNTLAPGFVDTPRLAERLDDDGRRAGLARVPLGRAATVEEVADAALFLLSSPFVTGSTLHLNGGELMP